MTSEQLLARAHAIGPERGEALRMEVVAANLGLARRLAARYYGRGEPSEDLDQVANLALILAVRRFDPAMNVSLADFATPTILGELRRHFRDKGWMVRPPRQLQELRPELRATQLELEQQLMREPTTAEVAAAMGLSAARVAQIELAATAYSPASLDRPAGVKGSATTLGDTIADEVDTIDETLTRITVRSLLKALTPRQRTIVELRYVAGMSQSQIGEQIGVSQVHVSRLLTQIHAILRAQVMTGGGPSVVGAG